MPRSKTPTRKARARSSDGRNDEIAEIDPLDFRCGICLCTMFRPVTLSCGHSLCEYCLAGWIQNRASHEVDGRISSLRCPAMCNQTMTPSFPQLNNILNNHIQALFPDDEKNNQKQYERERHAATIRRVREQLPTQNDIARALELQQRGGGHQQHLARNVFGEWNGTLRLFHYVYGHLQAYLGPWPDHIVTYSSLFSWLLFACVCSVLIYTEHQHCNEHSVSPYPNSTSSFMYLQCPIRDLATFYKEYAADECDTSAAAGNETLCSTQTAFEMTPLDQLLTHPSSVVISEWLKRDPEAPLWFNKRHLMLIVYFLPLALPRISVLLWLRYSSHGAILPLLLNPGKNLLATWWRQAPAHLAFFTPQTGFLTSWAAHEGFWFLFIVFPRFLPIWFIVSFRGQDPGMVVGHLLLQLYLFQWSTIHCCGSIQRAYDTLVGIPTIGGRKLAAAVCRGYQQYFLSSSVVEIADAVLGVCLLLLWPIIPWLLVDSLTWLCASGVVAVVAMLTMSGSSLHSIRRPDENVPSHRDAIHWFMRTVLKLCMCLSIFLLMQVPHDNNLIHHIRQGSPLIRKKAHALHATEASFDRVVGELSQSVNNCAEMMRGEQTGEQTTVECSSETVRLLEKERERLKISISEQKDTLQELATLHIKEVRHTTEGGDDDDLTPLSWNPYPWLNTPHDRRASLANRSMLHIMRGVEWDRNATSWIDHGDFVAAALDEDKFSEVVERFPLTYMHAVHPEVLLCVLVFVLVDYSSINTDTDDDNDNGANQNDNVDHRTSRQKLIHSLVSRFWTTMVLILFLGAFYENGGYNNDHFGETNKITGSDFILPKSTGPVNEIENDGLLFSSLQWAEDKWSAIGTYFHLLLQRMGSNMLYWGSASGVWLENMTSTFLNIHWGATFGVDLIIVVCLALAKLNVHFHILYVWAQFCDGCWPWVVIEQQTAEEQMRQRNALEEQIDNGEVDEAEAAIVRAAVGPNMCRKMLLAGVIISIAFGGYVFLLYVNQQIMY